jgi:hypothetical protein
MPRHAESLSANLPILQPVSRHRTPRPLCRSALCRPEQSTEAGSGIRSVRRGCRLLVVSPTDLCFALLKTYAICNMASTPFIGESATMIAISTEITHSRLTGFRGEMGIASPTVARPAPGAVGAIRRSVE